MTKDTVEAVAAERDYFVVKINKLATDARSASHGGVIDMIEALASTAQAMCPDLAAPGGEKTLREELEALDAELEALKATKEALEARVRDVYRRSLEAAEADKVAKDTLSTMLARDGLRPRYIQYPIEVSAIAWAENNEPLHKEWSAPTGSWVAVRPCAPEHENKTFLGILLGSMALGMTLRHHQETGILHVAHTMHNPAIYVPDLKKVVWGCGSWWHTIDKPEDLKRISDKTIDNVWYVRVLKELGGQP